MRTEQHPFISTVARAAQNKPNSSWTLHATGKICPQPNHGISPVIEQEALAEIQARCSEQISGEDYYLRLNDRGINYGPSFQSITQFGDATVKFWLK